MASLRKLLVGLFLIITAMGAQATLPGNTYNLGNLPAGYTSFGPNSAYGNFLDTINFSVLGDEGSFGVGALNFSVGGTPMMNITGLSMSLFDNQNTLLGSGLDFNVDPLTSGSYYLAVTGNANGVLGGMYAGGIQITAVPEPGLKNSLLVGLALMAFIAMRRRDLH